MGRAVVIKRAGVVDGQVSENLLIGLRRVPALAHHRQDQSLRVRDGPRRRVDEVLLDRYPPARVPGARGGADRPDVQAPDPPYPPGELGLGLPPATALLDQAVVLGTEAPPKTALAAAVNDPGRDAHDHDGGHDDDDRDNPG